MCENHVLQSQARSCQYQCIQIKFGEILSNSSQAIERKHNSGVNQGHNSDTNLPKMMCNNPKLDLVNMNAYIKFGEILSIGCQDIERKQNFGINQGP